MMGDRWHKGGRHRIVGLMSGTSMDAVDAALVEIEGSGRDTRWNIVAHTQTALPVQARRALLLLASGRSAARYLGGAGPAAQVALMDVWLGEVFAAAALQCVRHCNVPTDQVDLIASHGQTICHLPEPTILGGTAIRTTMQIGRAAIIAGRTGVPVLSDFRSADIAAGGEGAPLSPYADWVLFSRPGQVLVVQNMGGIGNLTYLPGDRLDEVIGFDTGPANMLVDGAMRRISQGRRHFDRHGAMARRGIVRREMVDQILNHPFFGRVPPRSTGHEEFGEGFLAEVFSRARAMAMSPEDLVATLTAVGPEAAVNAYRRFLPRFPDEVILGGGGSLNPIVVEHFQRLCVPARVSRHEAFGIPAQAKECLAFAILANETMHGTPATLPAVTGASRPTMAGAFCPGAIAQETGSDCAEASSPVSEPADWRRAQSRR